MIMRMMMTITTLQQDTVGKQIENPEIESTFIIIEFCLDMIVFTWYISPRISCDAWLFDVSGSLLRCFRTNFLKLPFVSYVWQCCGIHYGRFVFTCSIQWNWLPVSPIVAVVHPGAPPQGETCMSSRNTVAGSSQVALGSPENNSLWHCWHLLQDVGASELMDGPTATTISREMR